jgi:hypothetical protein
VAYAAKGNWKSSANDAQECINVNPSFIKGYYRLAKAQSEQNEFDAALATINKGLAVGGNDREQKKMMRKLKAEVKEAKAAEYQKTATDQFQGAFDRPFQLMESLGMLKRERDPQMERKVTEKMIKEDKVCVHGINAMHYLMPEGRFYQEFRNTFQYGLNNVTYQTTKYRLGEEFGSAFQATVTKFPEEWKDASKIGLVVTHWVAEGTQCLLDGDIGKARCYASYAFFLQDMFSFLNGTKATPNSARVEELFEADEHTLVSFLKKHIPCCCLDEKYKEVKSTPKMSFCYNEHCSLPGGRVERSKANPCSRCRSAFYCSRECQVADWKRHKFICGVNAGNISRSQKDSRKEAGMRVPTVSQSPQEPAVNNPIAATEFEIAEQAKNETETGGGNVDENVATSNDDSPETSAAGDVADLPPRATGLISSVRRLFGF